jgi:hypothetical protein
MIEPMTVIFGRRSEGVLLDPRRVRHLGLYRHHLAQPFVLILLGASVAGLMMSIYGAQVWYVNRKFLPKELQAPRWRQAALLLFSAFFGFFTSW